MRRASRRTCQKAGSASRAPFGAASCSTVKSRSPLIQRMSRSCGIQLRNSSLSRPQASASMPFIAAQSKTQGSGICSASEESLATPSASR